MPREHDFVELLVEQNGVPPLLVGTRDVVVHLNQVGRACEVEFLRQDGSTICIRTTDIEHLKIITTVK